MGGRCVQTLEPVRIETLRDAFCGAHLDGLVDDVHDDAGETADVDIGAARTLGEIGPTGEFFDGLRGAGEVGFGNPHLHGGGGGGFVIVIFFSFWAETFGRAHLGRIVGSAQMMTVLASAVGPLVLAQCHAATGSYAAVFYVLAGIVVLLAFAAWVVKVPRAAAATS